MRRAPDHALEIALANTAAELTPLRYQPHVTGVSTLDAPGTFGVDSASLLFPELWTDIAGRAQGDLVVSAPAQSLVLFADSANSDALEDLSRVTANTYDAVIDPLSPRLHRWTPAGFTPFHPVCEAAE